MSKKKSSDSDNSSCDDGDEKEDLWKQWSVLSQAKPLPTGSTVHNNQAQSKRGSNYVGGSPLIDLSSLTAPPSNVQLPSSKPPITSSGRLSRNAPAAVPEYAMNIGSIEPSGDALQPRSRQHAAQNKSLIETEKVRRSKGTTPLKASRIVRY